jgi:hypothetical protein
MVSMPSQRFWRRRFSWRRVRTAFRMKGMLARCCCMLHSSLKRNHMRRFIITGAPGAGKTAIIRRLELDGFSVVEEAATDVIAAAHAQGTVEPWRHPSFLDGIAHLQRERQLRINRMRFSFTTVALSVRRRWRSTLGTLFLSFLPANWSASGKKPSTKTESSSSAILASSRLPKRGESVLRKRFVLKRFTKRPTGTSASNWSQSSQEVRRNGSRSSKRQFGSRSGLRGNGSAWHEC